MSNGHPTEHGYWLLVAAFVALFVVYPITLLILVAVR